MRPFTQELFQQLEPHSVFHSMYARKFSEREKNFSVFYCTRFRNLYYQEKMKELKMVWRALVNISECYIAK